MQLRRAVPLPLSLVALLASAGCVSVGPRDPAPVPAHGSVPPLGAPEDPSAGTALPLGQLPPAAAGEPRGTPVPEPGRSPASGSAAEVVRPAPDPAPRRAREKAVPHPRHTRAAGPAGGHPRRPAAPPARMDEMCAAADGAGVVPPSIVDLCLRQYGH
ncbi:hypothetical protein [Streptomyces sp. NPDC090112]|uniref:hypothetical protein n=1 Tax=Streptomyces sp. NPDC090112 TaxID=3365949 RepID=UPI0037F13F34